MCPWTQPTGKQFPLSGREFTSSHWHGSAVGPVPTAVPKVQGGHQASCHTPTPVISKDRAACTQDPPFWNLEPMKNPI